MSISLDLRSNHSIKTASILMSEQQDADPRGIICVIERGILKGVISDGDIRRYIAAGGSSLDDVTQMYNQDPVVYTITDTANGTGTLAHLSQASFDPSGELPRWIPCVDERRQLVKVVDSKNISSGSNVSRQQVNIVGCGYVGLTLAVHLASKGIQVVGVEANQIKLDALQSRRCTITEDNFGDSFIRAVEHGNLEFHSTIDECSSNRTGRCVWILAVGTPIDETKELPVADLRDLSEAFRCLAPCLNKGDLILTRSTLAVGTMDELVLNLKTERPELVPGLDYNISYCPERTLAGDALAELSRLPQLISGLTSNCSRAAEDFWTSVGVETVRCESFKEAEVIKLTNNTYRDMSFAISNYIASVCETHDLDALSVFEKAKRNYKRGQMPIPSPGVGGYCLTKDPLIFAASTNHDGFPNLAKFCRDVNQYAEMAPIRSYQRWLTRTNKNISNKKILCIGMAFKGYPKTNDMRGSTGITQATTLRALGADVSVYDFSLTPKELSELATSKQITAATNIATLDGYNALFLLNNSLDNQDLLHKILKSDIEFICDPWGSLYSCSDEIQSNGKYYATLGN